MKHLYISENKEPNYKNHVERIQEPTWKLSLNKDGTLWTLLRIIMTIDIKFKRH